MESFKAIYKILRILETAMKFGQLDLERLTPESLGITESHLKELITMMMENHYVKGAYIKTYVDGGSVMNLENLKITLEGLEYLQENSTMKKIYNAAKGISDLIT